MDPRLLRYYNLELQHLREMGAEFAQQFPKIAARLSMNGLEVADPYVERLLEAVGFLAARVQLKLDAEFPRFTQSLLEIVCPHYLCPTPSMLIARLQPDRDDPGLLTGRRVPRGTVMQSVTAADDQTPCEFRTAHDVVLHAVEIANVRYFSFAPDLPLTTLPYASRIKGGLRITLRATAGATFAQTNVDRLEFYLGGRDDVANTLLELCIGASVGVLVRGTGPTPVSATLPATAVRAVGYADEDALLPVTNRSFQGYRLLQEYFTFPQRFRFMAVEGLRNALAQAGGTEVELVLLFGRGDTTLESVVDVGSLSLYCTPAVNLFEKPRIDRVNVTDSTHEFHVVADRTRPLDFEIYQVLDVIGHGAGEDGDRRFLPFYATSSADPDHQSYFTTRREPRLVSQEQRRRGLRSSYIGTEVFLSLVDSAQAPYAADLRQLSLRALCTNRDLPLQMPLGVRESDLLLDVAAPVKAIRVVAGPSRPYAPVADGAVAWRAISHLALNYLSLVDVPGPQGAATLRDLLELYATTGDVSARRQIEGVRSVGVQRVVRRVPSKGPIAFGRGLEITVEVDELAFEGGSAFLLGAVLARHFARYVSINSVTETVLRSQSRGEVSRWTPDWGTRPTL
ncbi:MAG: type VI secretion system baseplate subunit TssF [Acidobacteria bacterium]|nr:type VI secretion system baseplate subunit TssF [Acidobacteriota bacterium]